MQHKGAVLSRQDWHCRCQRWQVVSCHRQVVRPPRPPSLSVCSRLPAAVWLEARSCFKQVWDTLITQGLSGHCLGCCGGSWHNFGPVLVAAAAWAVEKACR